MAKKCDVCGKGSQFGSTISHAHNVSKRRWLPNLQRVRVVIDGQTRKLDVCTNCLKSEAVQKGIKAGRKIEQP